MAIRLRTELCERLNIDYPIFLAGLAGGPGTPELVAAVSAAGGFGTLGAAYMNPSEIREAIRRIRSQTERPFGVNLFVPDTAPENNEMNETEISQAISLINQVRTELGLEEIVRIPEPNPDPFDEQLAVLFDEGVKVIGTTFGPLPAHYRKEAEARKITVITMVTSVKEAIEAESCGAEILVVQGAEAGGHRGTFDIHKHPNGSNVGSLALIPQVADKVRVPIIAAGGIMDGRGLVASLALGAQGAQLGTRFLTAREAGTNQAHREALVESVETDTEITKAFSGRPARGIVNNFMRLWQSPEFKALPFPVQNTLTRDIRAEAAKRGDAENLSLWAGQGLRLVEANESVDEIIAKMIKQAQLIMGN